MQPELTNETFVGEFGLRFAALVEALKSPGGPLSELPGFLRASKRVTECNLTSATNIELVPESNRYLSSVSLIGISSRYLIGSSHRYL